MLDLNDPKDQERYLATFNGLCERHRRGEITLEQLEEMIIQVIYPDDPEAQDEMRSIGRALTEAGWRTAIEMAVRLPGIPIPVGKLGED
jgi:hypothetical protein